MIRLRKLKTEDAPLMLEWMHNKAIADVFEKDMSTMTLEKAKEFCKRSSGDISFGEDAAVHYAIAESDSDEYMGTISLKNIDMKNRSAEFAISVRPKFHGTNTAGRATRLILQKGFGEFRIHRIYLSVFSTNARAIQFYEKCGFRYEGESRDGIRKNERFINLKWYSMLDTDFETSGGVSVSRVRSFFYCGHALKGVAA